MSSNEDASPKSRASLLEYRNTDLVSRLLAATPPYLYNMPLVPNSYFFSEMLRSFVIAKQEQTSRGIAYIQHRKPRKRSWTQTRSEYYKDSKPEKRDMPPPSWTPKTIIQEKPLVFEHNSLEKPLELTMGKFPLINNNISDAEVQNASKMELCKSKMDGNFNMEKQELADTNISNHTQIIFPTVSQTSNQENPPDLILPPAPPIWYPPLYPAPYGMDPLHFFIDLRVSGHIYDRKNEKDCIVNNNNMNIPISRTPPNNISHDDSQNYNQSTSDCFKHTRHASAFTVPTQSLAKNIPINLSNNKFPNYAYSQTADSKENKCLKFDVKSLVFEKDENRTGTHYIMNNINKIYKNLQIYSYEKLQEENKLEENANEKDGSESKEETQEEKQKRVKDLQALIGLELVVDYMKHAKPGQQNEKYPDTDTEDCNKVELQDSDCTYIQN